MAFEEQIPYEEVVQGGAAVPPAEAVASVSPELAFEHLDMAAKGLGLLRGMHVFRRSDTTGDGSSISEIMVTQARRLCPGKLAVFAGFNSFGLHPHPEFNDMEQLAMSAFRFVLNPQRIVGLPEWTCLRPKGSTRTWSLRGKGPFFYLQNGTILDVRHWHKDKLPLPEGPALHVPLDASTEAAQAEALSTKIEQFSPVDEVEVFSMLPQLPVQ